MTISKFCKQLGMDLKGYRSYKAEIETKANELKEIANKKHSQGTGVYYQTSEILEVGSQESYFIIDAMKEIGFEFINDLTLYRVC